MTRYGFQQAVSAFFLADIEAMRKFLPQRLTPIEVRPGHGILAITAFDFIESEVGAYCAFVVSVVLPPFAAKGHDLPQFSSFPIILSTSTPASRIHATEQWHLPQYDSCLDIRFSEDDKTHKFQLWDGDLQVLELSVERGQRTAGNHLYQCFTSCDGQIFRADVRFIAALDENENETGKLVLCNHPLADRLAGMITDDIPLREQSIGSGEEQFESLILHGEVV
jgi:hypothetical protein